MSDSLKEEFASTVQKILRNQPLDKNDFIVFLQLGEDLVKSVVEKVRETLETVVAAVNTAVDIVLYPVTWLLEKVNQLLLAFA